MHVRHENCTHGMMLGEVLALDIEDTKRLVQNYTQESENYIRQLHIWLGTGSAGGAIALATLAASLPNPAHALQYLAASFWCFLVGVVSAGGATFMLAMRASAKGIHFASAHNRENLNVAISSTPEIISSPPSIADRSNAKRNQLIELSNKEHDIAERAWKSQSRWKIGWIGMLIISCASFVGGFGWPLVKTSFLEQPIVLLSR